MKRAICLLVCLAMLPFIVPIGAEEEKPPLQVAIYPFDGLGVEQTFALIVTNSVYRELIKSKKLIVRDQNSTDAAIKELGFSQTGFCADDACKIEVGKIIKAQKLLMGTVEKVDENYYTVSMRVVDVQTGATEYQAQQDCNCARNVDVRDHAVQLVNTTILVYLETGRKPEPPKVTPSTPAPTPTQATPRVTAVAPPTEGLIDLFFNALEAGDVNSAKKLLEENPGLVYAQRKEDGHYPLHVAAKIGNLEFAKLLIEKGAIVSAKNNNGGTALHWAKTKEMAELFIANGAQIDAKSKDGVTPLMYISAEVCNQELAEYLISQGADVNAKDNYGSTPIWYATSNNCTELAKILIAKGADVNAKGPGTLTCIKYYGATMQSKSSNLTALHIAVDLGLIDIAQMLLEKGANPNAQANITTILPYMKVNFTYTYKGFTPLNVAVDKGNKSVVELLISKGADVKATYDADHASTTLRKGEVIGITALHDAASYCYSDIAEILIRAGADVSATYSSYYVFTDTSLGSLRTTSTMRTLIKYSQSKDKAACEATAQVIRNKGK